MLNDCLEIVLVTYNRRVYLQNTLKQIMADDSPIKNLKITILDNNSTDGSSELIDEYVKIFPNIKHIIHNRNIGGNANITRAFEIATKKYLWVLCDDDNFDFANFKTIEDKLSANIYDVIFTVNCEDDLADVFYQASFVPACIYNTELISNSVMENIFCNIPNFFPHLAMMAKVINRNGKIATLSYCNHEKQIVNRGGATDDRSAYIRSINDDDLNLDRRNIYWFVGYINSLQLIRDKSKRAYVINHTKHCCDNIFRLMVLKLEINMRFYNFYYKNFLNIYLGLNFYQKIFLFIPSYIIALFRYLFIKKEKIKNSIESWQEYIKEHKILQKLDAKVKKYKGKKILLYGTGMITEALLRSDPHLLEKFDAVSDKKVDKPQQQKDSKLYIVPPYAINDFGADVIFLSVYRFDMVKKSLRELGIKCKMEKIL